MAKSNEERVRFANDEILGKGNLDVVDVEVELLIQAGDTIAWQRTLSGTHKADMMGIPPTGKKVEWRDMHGLSFRRREDCGGVGGFGASRTVVSLTTVSCMNIGHSWM
ncbi:MAG: ester cyclase [Planctomycetota bacterium]|nr:ester cyclase [Planctomycetota bacterium]